MKVLFVCKYRHTYQDEADCSSSTVLSSGLYNSARMVTEMMREHGVDAALVHAIDNNCIDKLVTDAQATHVVIEAFWVVPEKFAELQLLHPNVKWYVRNHSNIPFLATEGVALEWAREYVKYDNVFLCTNTTESLHNLRVVVGEAYVSKVLFFPNYYHSYADKQYVWQPIPNELHVGCFGAIRQLKNQVIQAIAAIQYAKEVGMHLHFYVNADRVEGKGDPVLKTLRSLFTGRTDATLIEQRWLPHQDFLDLMRRMDVLLQVSYTETFNIVTADAVTCGVPVVASSQVSWLPCVFHVDPNATDSIVRGMRRARLLSSFGSRLCQNSLDRYNRRARNLLLNVFNHQ